MEWTEFGPGQVNFKLKVLGDYLESGRQILHQIESRTCLASPGLIHCVSDGCRRCLGALCRRLDRNSILGLFHINVVKKLAIGAELGSADHLFSNC